MEELGARQFSDLQNLMAATAIATLFLDRDLRIMRYTPTAAPTFQPIPSDIGRPLPHLQHRLEYPELIADAERVLRHAHADRARGAATDGRWYLARLLPYRTHGRPHRRRGAHLRGRHRAERSKRDLAEDLASTSGCARSASARPRSRHGGPAPYDILDAAIFITHADAGMVQLLDEDRRQAADARPIAACPRT